MPKTQLILPINVDKADYTSCSTSEFASGVCLSQVCGVCNDMDGVPKDLAGCRFIGWTPMKSQTGGVVRAVWVASPVLAYAGGADGVLLRYDGAAWAPDAEFAKLGVTVEIIAIWGSDGDNMFVLTSSGQIFRLAGGTWSDRTPPASGVTAIWGVAANHVLAVGIFGEIWKFDGVTWTQQASGTTSAAFAAVWGGGSEDVYVGGTDGGLGVIRHFDGSVWSSSHSIANTTINAIWGSGPRDVFAGANQTGAATTIVHFDGAAWTAMPVPRGPMPLDVISIWGSGPSDVFVAGYNDMLPMARVLAPIFHFDGVSWSPMTTPNRNRVYQLAGSGTRDVLAVGSSGLIWRYTGASWAPLDPLPVPALTELRDVWASAPNRLVAVGTSGTIAQLDEDRLWSDKTIGFDVYNGVTGRSAQEMFAVGNMGAIVQTTDGVSWSAAPQNAALGSALHDVAATANSLFAAGDGLYAAPTWTQVAALSEFAFGLFANANDLYLAGIGIKRFDGTSVIELVPGPDRFNAIWGSGANDIYAVGPSGKILHYDGARWSAEAEPVTGNNLNDVWGTSVDDVFAVGDKGTILHYRGERWTVLTTPTTVDLQGVSGNGNSVYFVGADATVLELIRGTLDAP